MYCLICLNIINVHLVSFLGKLEEIQEAKRRQETMDSDEYLQLKAKAHAEVKVLLRSTF